ncbi:hypothetical protein PCANC_19380 [Puccinia coronata f. sp. avenae]|uniref:Uncharacterized protein n=1 Tax=Puccinia coronata f. sp. avenae TaxID=200324 RepID=A0A2N5SDW4_9BASI|nr:hypothetical protein PCANC_27438 [Puccinia coronata f. sp. avenae]PLW39646.1 hypothetical protein PCANC_19380 [Puccinia coronata f. sp. avenae]
MFDRWSDSALLAGWTGLSNQFLGPVAQDQLGPCQQRNNPACQHFHQAAHPTAPHNTAHLPAAGYVPNFQGFYSIVAPTGYTGMYPQVQAPPHQAPGPTGNNTQPADSYRLQYWLQQVNNRRLPDNSSTLPASQPAARFTNTSSVSLCDAKG